MTTSNDFPAREQLLKLALEKNRAERAAIIREMDALMREKLRQTS